MLPSEPFLTRARNHPYLDPFRTGPFECTRQFVAGMAGGHHIVNDGDMPGQQSSVRVKALRKFRRRALGVSSDWGRVLLLRLHRR